MSSDEPLRMSDVEALMWNVEKDPFLSSNVGALAIMDGPVNVNAFTNKVAHAVAAIPRLRQRPEATLGRLSPPVWVTDTEFDLEHHVRVIGVGGTGSHRDLLDLVTLLLQDPLDRTRPLWQFFVIEGLEGHRSALFSKLHHTVTDGEGGIRLSARYMDADADAQDPGPVDLAPILAAEAPEPNSFSDAAVDTVGHTLRRNLGRLRRLAGDAALAAAEPQRVPEVGGDLIRSVRQSAEQLGSPGPDTGSSLWKPRSRRRRLDTALIPFTPVREAARATGNTINDLFVVAAAEAAARYHQACEAPIETLNVTFVVSTRSSGDDVTSNSFSPTKVALPAGPMDLDRRLAACHEALAAKKGEVRGAGVMSGVAGVANLLPTSVLTNLARGQASGVDIATSNVRAAPFDVYVGGAKVLESYPIGPVAGTAVNITMMSYAGQLGLGIHSDPAAIDQPEMLRDLLISAFADLVALGGHEM